MSPKKGKPEISIEWLDVTIDIKVCGSDIPQEERGFVRLFPELDPKLLSRDQIDRNRMLFRKERKKLQTFEYKLVPTNPTKEDKPKVLPKLTCDHCGKSFSRRSTLEQHIASHDRNNSSWEDVQDAALQDLEQAIVFGGGSSSISQGIEELEIKGAEEEEEIPAPQGSVQEFRCPTCDQVFPKSSLLTKHMSTHSADGLKPYSCSVCGWKFLQKYNLKKHMWSHSLEAPNRCVECLTLFPDTASLRDHVQTYHDQEEMDYMENELTVGGVNPPELIPCPKCKRKFAAQAHLDRHMPVHNNMLKPYECDICGWKFHLLHNMERHRATHANGKKAKIPPHKRLRKKKIKSKNKALLGLGGGSIPEQVDAPVGQVKEFSNDFSDEDVDLSAFGIEEETYPLYAGVPVLPFPHMEPIKMPVKKPRKKREMPKEKPYECDICGWKFHLHHNMERHRATHAKGKKAKLPPHVREQMKNDQQKASTTEKPGMVTSTPVKAPKADEPVGKVKEFSNEFSDEDVEVTEASVEVTEAADDSLEQSASDQQNVDSEPIKVEHVVDDA